MKRKTKKISRKVTVLLILTVCSAVLLSGGIGIFSLFHMKKLSTESSMELGRTAAADAEKSLEQMAGEQLRNLVQEKAAYINEKFAEVEADVSGIASLTEHIYDNPQRYPDRPVEAPKKNSKELAAQLLFSNRLAQPETEQTQELLKLGNVQDLLVQYNEQNEMISSAYLATVSGWMLQADYIADSKFGTDGMTPDYYEADTRQWYQKALSAEEGETVYSDVMVDVHGGGDCIVCAQPVYHNGKIAAVAGIGSYLDTVNHTVLNTTIGEGGYAFLVNQNGSIMISKKTTGDTAAHADKPTDLRSSDNSELKAAAENMVAGENGLVLLTLDGEKVYLAYAPLDRLHWSFCTVMPVEEVIAPAKESQQTILDLTEQMTAQQEMTVRQMLLLLIAMVPIAFLVVSLAGSIFSRKITNPICRLTADVEKLSGGNLDYRIEVRTGDEVEDLGEAFNTMTAQLKNYISNLAAVTAERERIRTELEVASRLQADMLPDAAGICKGREDFSLQAFMKPAKSVGGDFYDFYLLDEDHLVLVAADVSGKGVPAALFMVVSKTLIRSTLSLKKPLAECMEEMNRVLCSNNKDSMFVTAWIGILTLSTGRLHYVNAGHCHPLLMSDGKYTYQTAMGGMVLAGLEDSKYKESCMQIHKGDILFQYSDGVIEAHNENQELFGEERLLQNLNQHKDLEPGEIIPGIWKELEQFRGEAEQFDDITMLAVCYRGDPKMEKPSAPSEPADALDRTMMVCTPQLEKLPEMTGHIELSLQGQLPRESMASVLTAVDEIYSNICRYSQADRVECTCHAGDGVVVLQFEDNGIPYNPLEKQDPDIEEELENRQIGGLGIYLVKKQMDQVAYAYKNGKNCLTLTKNAHRNKGKEK